ncbi:hypothetical protein L596_009136 [Steinernema carpocapsae]|uniref:RING-type E3 ubiquitin transferase n=1 Tax=Steinernema carpocapsae TaxID=34508 RepID=A0A4U5PFN9_STECR|nr:hypothetical protein L596_009136 [Steinernema carpocapsae]
MGKRGGWRRSGGVHASGLSDYDKEYLSTKSSRPDFEVDPQIAVFENVSRELSCPICHQIIRKTKVTVECNHRFCAPCIVAELRSGSKACPVCKKPFAKNGPIKDDQNFDAIVDAIRSNQPRTPAKAKFSDVFKKELHSPPQRKRRSDEFPALRAELNESPQETKPKLKVFDASDGFVAPPISGTAPLLITPPSARPHIVKEFRVDINKVSRNASNSKLSIDEGPLREILSHFRNVNLPADHRFEIEVLEPTDPTDKTVVVRVSVLTSSQVLNKPEPLVRPVKVPPKRKRFNDEGVEALNFHKRMMNSKMNMSFVVWPDRSHHSKVYGVPEELNRPHYAICEGENTIEDLIDYLFNRANVEFNEPRKANVDFKEKFEITFCIVSEEKRASKYPFAERMDGPPMNFDQLCDPKKSNRMMINTIEPFNALASNQKVKDVLNTVPSGIRNRPFRLVYRVTAKSAS